jgi:hypothetical protein
MLPVNPSCRRRSEHMPLIHRNSLGSKINVSLLIYVPLDQLIDLLHGIIEIMSENGCTSSVAFPIIHRSERLGAFDLVVPCLSSRNSLFLTRARCCGFLFVSVLDI